MKFFARIMLCLMISFTLIESPVIHAHASMISTTDALDLMQRDQAEKRVSEFLKRSDVKEQLIQLGLDPEVAQKRLAGLSDQEVKKLSTDIKEAKLGGDVGGILVVVLLVLLIIYLAKRI
jgi:hypothetical protein